MTIHFDGQLLGEEAFRGLVRTAVSFAASRTWLTEPIESDEITLLRVGDNEEEWNYCGPVEGELLYPSEDCDPTHLEVLELLRGVKPFFRDLQVEDEGEYGETGDLLTLAEHMKRVQQVIDEQKKNNLSVQVKVKTPDGRIMDLMT